MRVIIAGSRTISNPFTLDGAIIKSGILIDEVVSGGVNGVDKLGILWAQRNNIPVKLFLPDWAMYGRSAGPIRNKQMAQYAQGLIAIWHKQSRGTKDMIDQARLNGLKIYIHEVT